MAKFVCKVCGYVHTGDNAPEACPQCKAKNPWVEVKEEGGFASVRQEFADVSNNESMNDVHISINSDEPMDTSSEQEARRDELFANPLSEKERKKKDKEDAKRRAQEEKERRKNPTPPPVQTKTKLPDWLRKK